MAITGRVAILHIGGEKTGSTTLQSTLALNRAELAKRGILYSRAAGGSNHILLPLHATAGEGTEDLRAASGLTRAGTFANFMARFPEVLRAEAEASGAHTLVYSSEHLSSRIRDAEGVRRLWAVLGDIADEIRLVYYARPQEEVVVSAWSTMLKSGSAEPFDPAQILTFETLLDHAALVERWSPFFADRYWIFRPFQRAQLAGGDIVADFCDQARLPLAALVKRVPPLNPSLDAPRAEFLRLYNRAIGIQPGTPQQGGRGEVVRLLERLSNGPPIHLPPAVLEAIATRFGPGNAAVAQRFLGRAELFVARRQSAPAGETQLTVEGAVEIAAALWQLARGRKTPP